MNILKEWQRMCRAMSNEDDVCSYDCPIWGNCPITCESIESIAEIDIKDMEREITEWAKANPLKTYLEDFKEKFPNAPGGYLPGGLCRNAVYTGQIKCCYADIDDMSCLKCWNRPMED